jgi:vancomycin resistance protein VanW
MKQKFIWLILVVVIFCIPSCSKPMPRPQQNNANLINNSDLSIPPTPTSNDETLPWENNPNFQETLAKYDNPILMAKYKATLHDPLPGEMYNVALAANKLAGTIVPPGNIFSQNKKLGPYNAAKGYRSGPMYKGTKIITAAGGGVCKIASVLYNLTVLSNLPVIERNCHSMTVPYVPAGQDATVCYGVKDFRFMNNTQDPLIIWAEAVDNNLYMAFYGQQKPPKVTWHHETLKHIKYWTIYKQNNQLPEGEQKIVIPGQDGYIVKSWITVEYPDGKTETKSRGKSYYNPLPEVIEKGPKKR